MAVAGMMEGVCIIASMIRILNTPNDRGQRKRTAIYDVRLGGVLTQP